MLVATDEATNVLTNSADLPGQIIDLGEGATQHGHYYGKSDNPTANQTSLGAPNSITSFTSQITGLEAGTKYEFKSYITDGTEKVYGKTKSFTTVAASAPVLTTAAVTSITLTGAVSGGNITSDGGAPVTDKGVCWNSFTGPTTSNNKTVDGTGTGTFVSTLTGLSAGSTYFIRAYATNSAGTTYGNEISFTTTAASVPTLTTDEVAGISYNSALGGGEVISDGGSPVLGKGVCWSTATGPTINNTKTSDGPGTGSFGSDISGLSPTTKYYVRAYATNIVGTAYGSEVSFTTSAAPVQLPVLTTVSPGNVTSVSAASGGNISDDGGASVTSRGVCWNTVGSPTTDGLKTTDGNGTGAFVSSITGLTPNTKYYVRAYAINSSGTGYGIEYNFTTLSASSAVLTTSAITSIAQTTASGGGNITSDGGSSITARGICWSLNQNPTLADANTVNDFGTGIFNSQLTNLSPGKTYFVRAYATNSTGTSYGIQVSFLTASDIPKVSTSAVGTVTATTAEAGGEVLDNNGSTTTTRGVCYNLIGSPTIGDNIKSETGGIGTFTVSLTGLTPNTNYYFKAFATNGVGTAYGSQVQFTTPATIPSLTTTAVSAITTTTATSGGVISTDGGSNVLIKGVCWGISTGPVSGGTNQTTDGSGSSNYSSAITGLLPNTTYYLRAYATNGKGTAYGNELTFKTNTVASTVPGAPTGVTAAPGNAQAEVTFTVPSTDGGSAITGYTVTSSPGDKTATGSASPVTVAGLTNGTSYTFTVTATNDIGTSIPSSASNSVTPSATVNVPSEPTGVSATSGNAQAEVTFTVPGTDGGSAITGYTVTSSPDGKTGTGPASPVTVTGLTNGTSYTFTVTATNINGTGPASFASNSVTPSTIPGAPNMGTATAGAAMATVTFTPPVSDGGSAITVFIVTSNPGGHQGTGVVSPVNVIGLTNGTAYTFTITATNINGTGPASTVSNSVIPSTVPDAPTIGTATAGNAQASVTFTAPVNNGGSSITGYEVTSSPDGKTASGSISPIIVTGLTNGTAYTFTVVAKNANGSGVASSPSNSVTPLTVPSISTTVASAIKSTSAISGGSVTSNGGSAVTVSGICWSTIPTPVATGSHTTDGTSTGTFASPITGLTLGQTYYARAYATNSMGTGYGNEISFTTALGVGDLYQGGIIGYILQSGDPGYVAGQTKGLIVAPVDQSTLAEWGCYGTITGADGTALGTGNQNTTDIVAGCVEAGIAAKLCNNLVLGGYSDWYLPSKDELNKLYLNKDAIGVFANDWYFSSSEIDNNTVWYQYFSNGNQYFVNKSGSAYVRAIRAFPAAPVLPALITTTASAITSTTATSGGNVLADGGADITARGVCWGLASGPALSGSHTTDATGSGVFTSAITGLTSGTLYYVRSYATNSVGTTYGNEVSFTSSALGNCGTVTDADLNTYNTVTIGSQCWMIENLKTTKYRDGTAIPNITGSSWSTQTDGAFRWYNDDIGNKSSYGALYNYYTVVNNHNLCPVGWHVPTDDEIKTLEKFLGMSLAEADATDWRGTDQGTQLKSTTGWNSGGNGTNSSGFNSIPAGNIYNNVFGSLGNSCFLWSTKEGNSTVAYSRSLSYSTTTVYRTVYNKNQGFSVRCLQGEGLVLPAVTTDAASSISSTAAVSGGNVTSNGGAAISARGVCWNTSQNPTVDLITKTVNGSSTGTFVSNLSALVPLTTYYVRAYATNSVGTAYGDEVSFTTTAAAGLAVGDSYQGGIVAYILQPGDPGYDVGQTKGLIAATSDQASSVTWWNGSNISTGATGVAIGSGRVNTTAIINAQSNTGSYAAKVCADYAGGGYSDWYLPSKDELDKLYNNRVAIGGFASFYYWGSTELGFNNAWIGGFDYGGSGYTLKESTANVRAIRAFPSANTIPSVTTTAASAITSKTATSGGNVLADGGASVSVSGVCWSTSSGPVATGSHTTDGTAIGTFVSSITGLTLGQTYYVRAYATNSVGTAYGDETSFTTALAIGDSFQGGIVAYILQSGDPGYVAGQTRGLIAAPSDQSTGAAWGCNGITITGADGTTLGTGNQNTTDILGGCTEAGIAAKLCNDLVLGGYSDWYLPSQEELYKLYLNNAAIGGFTFGVYYWSSSEMASNGAFGMTMTDGEINNFKDALSYVRAVRAFPAAPVLPAVSTTAASAITSTSATSGGNVLADGGANVTERGVCWGTTSGPTISSSRTSDGTGTGVFTSSLTGLFPSTTYYVRAYATNNVGIVYGGEVSFTTMPAIGSTYLGGKLAYLLQPGDLGYNASTPHGIIAALIDQSTNAEWGCNLTLISGADGTALGTGLQNTIEIMAGCATAGIAARLCRGVTINGYTDWYLPSMDELNKLYLNRVAIGGFTSNYYWSSTEYNNSTAWNQYFGDGVQSNGVKSTTSYVRAVRAF